MARFSTNKLLLDQVANTLPGGSNTAVMVDTSLRKMMSIQFTSGSSNAAYDIEISNDGSNWVRYNRLTANATNTNAQTDTGSSTVAVNAGTSAIYFIRYGDYFRYIRASVSGVNGSFTAVLQAVD